MTIHPPTLDDLLKVSQWREDCRESLRTPYMVSGHQQENYLAQIEAMPHKMRMWSFWEFPDTAMSAAKGRGLRAFGGLQDIQWENGLAEISLIVNPKHKREGVGGEAVEMILYEAFSRLGLKTVWGECYDCGSREFWEKCLERYGGRTYGTRLPDRKYWNGLWYDSLYFSFHA